MPCVRSNENAAARWIKSLFNNAHLLCQLLFTLILLTYTKEEKSSRILFLEISCWFICEAAAGLFRHTAHGHTVFLSSIKGSCEVTFHSEDCFNSVGGILKVFCWYPKGKLDWGAMLLHFIFYAFCLVFTKKRNKNITFFSVFSWNWPAWSPIITHCVHCLFCSCLPAQTDGFQPCANCVPCSPTSSVVATVVLSSL